MRSWLLVLVVPVLLGCSQRGHPPGRERSPQLTVSGERHQVGFSREVRLTARVQGGGTGPSVRWHLLFGTPYDRDGRPLKWTEREGPTLVLHTRPPPGAKRATEHEGSVVPLSAQQAGRIVLEVRVRAGGASLSRIVEVTAAYPTAAWPRAAAGVDVYLGGSGTSVERGRMQLAPAGVPHLQRARWPASGATGEWNTLRHPRRDAPLTLRGGVWLGSRDCGRFDCHPQEQRGWLTTNHASVFRRAVDGRFVGPHDPRGPYREWCASCHTLGRQPGADNDGFDDRARAAGWRMPSKLAPGNWRHLPRELRERANVQCESCHGPGWFYTGHGTDICAQCHDRPPRYRVVAQLGRNRMLQAHRSLEGGRTGEACAGCHVGQGFLRSLRGHDSASRPGVDLDTRQHGVTCAACHDPHASNCARQLRLCGEVEIPGKTFDAGQGALCIACHSGEANIVRGPLLRPYLPGTAQRSGHGQAPTAAVREAAAGPHAPQFQLLTGRGGKFLHLPGQATEARVYPHMEIPDTCVHCHRNPATRRSPGGGHSFKLLTDPRIEPLSACPADVDVHLNRVRRSPVTAPCVECHGPLPTLDARARGDYDGNGRIEGLVREVQGLMRLLRQELAQQIAALGLTGANGARGRGFTLADEQVVVADGECRPLRRGAAPLFLPPALHKAAHNYLMVARDGSGGVHNPQYTVRLLQDAIEGLERRRGVAPRHRWKHP